MRPRAKCSQAPRGDSWLRSNPHEFVLLAVASIPLWLIFEGYNRLIRNWYYVGLTDNRLLRYVVHRKRKPEVQAEQGMQRAILQPARFGDYRRGIDRRGVQKRGLEQRHRAAVDGDLPRMRVGRPRLEIR